MYDLAATRRFGALAVLAAVSAIVLAGPPFQTDDPQPIDFKHYELYTFAATDGTPVETDIVGPAPAGAKPRLFAGRMAAAGMMMWR